MVLGLRLVSCRAVLCSLLDIDGPGYVQKGKLSPREGNSLPKVICLVQHRVGPGWLQFTALKVTYAPDGALRRNAWITLKILWL